MDELKKTQGRFLVRWAIKCIKSENLTYSIKIKDTDAKGLAIMGVALEDNSENGNGISVQEKDKDNWKRYFEDLCKEGIIMKNLNGNYVFVSEDKINFIIDMAIG